jgi:RES domain-containing protein
LRIPSAVITVERNFLLKPPHPDAQQLRIRIDKAFSFDRRLL